MNKIKKIALIFLVFISVCVPFRIFTISQYKIYKFDGETLYLDNEVYTFVNNDDILVTNEKEILGLAGDNESKKNLDTYISPHYIKKVDTNIDGDFVMISTIMWNGLFRKK